MTKSKIFFFCIFLIIFLVGCGYTTQGFMYKENSIYVQPVVNKAEITNEIRRYSTYESYPILLEKKLTNKIVDKLINRESGLKIAKSQDNALRLECELYRYNKEALSYTDSDSVQQQRLRLYLHLKLYNSQNELIKEKDIVGETTYYLTGAYSKSESAAQDDLIDDTARRVVETIVEQW